MGDWIERLFGLAPDGDSGSLELAIVIALAVVVLGIALYARRQRGRIA